MYKCKYAVHGKLVLGCMKNEQNKVCISFLFHNTLEQHSLIECLEKPQKLIFCCHFPKISPQNEQLPPRSQTIVFGHLVLTPFRTLYHETLAAFNYPFILFQKNRHIINILLFTFYLSQ